jgi:peptide/nickel transport system ATP-binding protein
MLPLTSGRVKVSGRDIAAVRGRNRRAMRRTIQFIYQDPYESLDPRLNVEAAVMEGLRIHRVGNSRHERRQRVMDALSEAGLAPPEEFLARLPHELSGGQRQRVAIAASIVLQPDLLVADEPVSMLDVSVRAGVLSVLSAQCAAGRGILMITHDLSTAASCADRVAVMYKGRLVEVGSMAAVIREPQHPYTKALLSAVPRLTRRPAGELSPRTPGDHETQPPPDPRGGCAYRHRCPIAIARCHQSAPEPTHLRSAEDHLVECFRASEPGPDGEQVGAGASARHLAEAPRHA